MHILYISPGLFGHYFVHEYPEHAQKVNNTEDRYVFHRNVMFKMMFLGKMNSPTVVVNITVPCELSTRTGVV